MLGTVPSTSPCWCMSPEETECVAHSVALQDLWLGTPLYVTGSTTVQWTLDRTTVTRNPTERNVTIEEAITFPQVL